MDNTTIESLKLFESPKYRNYLKIAMQLTGFGITEYGTDLLVELMMAIVTRGGDLSINEITDIESKLKSEYQSRKEEQPTTTL